MIRQKLARALPRGLKDRVKRYIREDIVPLASDDGFVASIRRLEPSITTVFDVGANVGDMTLQMCEQFAQATVYAFEPCAGTFTRLRERAEASPHADRIKVFNLGFYDEPGRGELHLTSFHGANSMLALTPEYGEFNPQITEKTTEEIKLTRLDDFVAEHDIERIDLLKVDVEGVEYQVLAGGRETLRDRVDAVICEIPFARHPRGQGEFIRLLEVLHEAGFAPAEIYDVAQGDTGTVWRLAQFDCVFRRFDR